MGPREADELRSSELTAERVEGRGKRLLTVIVRLLVEPVAEESEKDD